MRTTTTAVGTHDDRDGPNDPRYGVFEQRVGGVCRTREVSSQQVDTTFAQYQRARNSVRRDWHWDFSLPASAGFGTIGRGRKRCVLHSRFWSFGVFLLAAMARHAALTSRLTRFVARPLVRRAFLMRGLAALARNISLLAAIHRRKSTILFSQCCLPA